MMTIITPLILVGVMLIVQFGLAYHAQNVLSGAAQDGAAAAARREGSPAQGAVLTRSLVESSVGSLLESTAVSSTVEGDRVVVTATGEVVSLLPFVGTLTVRATGSAPIEDFRPQGESS